MPSSPTVVAGVTAGGAFTEGAGGPATAEAVDPLADAAASPVGAGAVLEQAAAARASSGSVRNSAAGMAPPTCHASCARRKKRADGHLWVISASHEIRTAKCAERVASRQARLMFGAVVCF